MVSVVAIIEHGQSEKNSQENKNSKGEKIWRKSDKGRRMGAQRKESR